VTRHITTVRCPRSLSTREQRVLQSLMRRKFYDCNHPEEGRRFPILRRAFVPADFQGNPVVVLLCQYALPDGLGRFDFCIYADGLYGRGHWASDSFGFGNMKQALAAFKEHVAYEVLGVWPWVINRVLKDAKRAA